jgi:hypothetical protein
MEKSKVLENLCWYDPRNPDYDRDYSREVVDRSNRYCDNCFHGKHELAEEILRLRSLFNEIGFSNMSYT